VLEGNPGKRAFNKNEPKPTIKAPSIPSHLTGEARNEWRRMVKLLIPLGLLTEIDRTALGIYCELYGIWVEAKKRLKEDGHVIINVQGNKTQNPYLGIMKGAFDQMKFYIAEFGMGPSSRSRINVPKPEAADPYEEYRQRKTAVNE